MPCGENEAIRSPRRIGKIGPHELRSCSSPPCFRTQDTVQLYSAYSAQSAMQYHSSAYTINQSPYSFTHRIHNHPQCVWTDDRDPAQLHHSTALLGSYEPTPKQHAQPCQARLNTRSQHSCDPCYTHNAHTAPDTTQVPGGAVCTWSVSHSRTYPCALCT